eukprot:CAMPEP_0195041122 /NCGR_PEP_ID=MMETSP0347-20130606/143_1 /TAXON_ID=2932 /ORGANISM="Alexandrium fundyense, Strain CCMP1719" /LENGTH=70 /DNA_ID=CAMNT_0040068087 /DNA_START=9 /DNA_END=218 /DNA_ORIENTATION=-
MTARSLGMLGMEQETRRGAANSELVAQSAASILTRVCTSLVEPHDLGRALLHHLAPVVVDHGLLALGHLV